MVICDHRFHAVETFRGPVRLVVKLLRCPDRSCRSRGTTFAPKAERLLAPPRMAIDWPVFCWIGYQRFARHGRLAEIREALAERWSIRLSDDVMEDYVRRYEVMVAGMRQDPAQMALAYKDVPDVELAIDGLQPEKGHETLYVVRELRLGRIWFAEPLLSGTDAAIDALIVRARDLAASLGKPVSFWVSDKQEAFLKAIAARFPGVPHRLCKIHFLRAVAGPTRKADATMKVDLRKKVRGLRTVERTVLASRQPVATTPTPPAEGVPVTTLQPSADGLPVVTTTPLHDTTPDPRAVPAPSANADLDPHGVVMDYTTAVRGVLVDGQGTAIDPPGVRMARALTEISESIERRVSAKKGVQSPPC